MPPRGGSIAVRAQKNVSPPKPYDDARLHEFFVFYLARWKPHRFSFFHNFADIGCLPIAPNAHPD